MIDSPDLFSVTGEANAPLAERLRPRRVEDVVGQRHLLAEGKPLAVALASGKLHSMILWGPPGVGKTTLARLLANAFQAEFIAISAVLAGVKEIREAVDRARSNARRTGAPPSSSWTRFTASTSRSRTPSFPTSKRAPHLHRGDHREPVFEVNGALLSRAQVYVLESLGEEDLDRLVVRGFEAEAIDVTEEARKRIAEFADGDGRRALNLVEQVASAARAAARRGVDAQFLEGVATRAGRRFDKGGENFYDQISALHKSVRGSDPDAALYWMVRMLDGGADPRYLARRMIRMATEDVGLADPRSLEIAMRAAEVYERLGSPEESWRSPSAWSTSPWRRSRTPSTRPTARRASSSRRTRAARSPAPAHAPTRLMKDLGYGKGYRYAHDEEGGYAAGESYLPDGMQPPGWYQPTDRGLEAKIREKLAWLRRRDKETGGGRT